MKTKLYFLLLFFSILSAKAQITSPVIKAGFGVDADLRANFFNATATTLYDDWYNASPGSGIGVIDTTGAAAIVNNYNLIPAMRSQSFFKRMAVPQYSVVNNTLLLDAMFYRDYHGDDSTVFASGSNKNGMSPVSWSCPVSQGIPDKNDILDVFTHIKRDGPNVTDSLWLMGGISIENTTGNRYFDFELYQTDLTYNRSTRTFTGYGPDAGHTAWLFDAAGNVTRAGDIIFSAEYSSSSLTLVEARIWVNRNSFTGIIPVNFNWGSNFDGANTGSQYGYASISPKTAGAFYTGLQSAPNAWAGPFALVRQDNSIAIRYLSGQFMEFSVNLSKLGLDPATYSNNPCANPFKRMLIKSRASTSFTAELKDFIMPFTLFEHPNVQAFTYITYQCVIFRNTTINVINPSPNSTYKWSTSNGIIIGPDTGLSIVAGAPGTYRVMQQLNLLCPAYSMDSVTLLFDSICRVMQTNLISLTAKKENTHAVLNWMVAENSDAAAYTVEQSYDGTRFIPVSQAAPQNITGNASYNINLPLPVNSYAFVYYRIRMTAKTSDIKYSNTALVRMTDNDGSSAFYPNPAPYGNIWFIKQLQANEPAIISIWDGQGKLVSMQNTAVIKGENRIKIEGLNGRAPGCYFVKLKTASTTVTGKIIVTQ